MPGGTLPVIDISEIEKRNYGTPFSSLYTPKNLSTNPRNFLLFEILINRERMPINFDKGSTVLLFVYA